MMDNNKQNIINVLDRIGKKLDDIGKRVDEIMDEMDIDKSSNQPLPLTPSSRNNTVDIVFVVAVVTLFAFVLVNLIVLHQ